MSKTEDFLLQRIVLFVRRFSEFGFAEIREELQQFFLKWRICLHIASNEFLPFAMKNLPDEAAFRNVHKRKN